MEQLSHQEIARRERANIDAYYALPDRHTTTSTTYPANYDGELDDVQPTEQDWSDFADACEEHDTHEEIMNRRVKPQFLIDDDDEYQDQLELMWYKQEHES